MTMSFKEAYGVLNKHAQTLRNQQEPNIDDLLRIVTESVDAYKVCKQRIDAVEAALEHALADPAVTASRAATADGGPPVQGARPPHPAGSTGSDNTSDDIPF